MEDFFQKAPLLTTVEKDVVFMDVHGQCLEPLSEQFVLQHKRALQKDTLNKFTLKVKSAKAKVFKRAETKNSFTLKIRPTTKSSFRLHIMPPKKNKH